MFLRQKGAEAEGSKHGLISCGRKWDANWSAPASLRDLHSPLLIRWSLGSNFFGGRILLLITFSHQQEGYCSESWSLVLSWLSFQLWSKRNPLYECQLFNICRSFGYPNPFQYILIPPHWSCPGNLLIKLLITYHCLLINIGISPNFSWSDIFLWDANFNSKI